MLADVALNSSAQMPTNTYKDDLPPIPPSDHYDNTPPPPPSKAPADNDLAGGHHRPPPIDTASTLSPHVGQYTRPPYPLRILY